MNKAEFIHLAKLIVQLFPQEWMGTYYIPAVKGEQAQGKLYSAYQIYKADLREAALFLKRPKSASSKVQKSSDLTEKSEPFKIILEESKDFDKILECWKFCYEKRQHLLSELSVFEYVRRFPEFNLSNAYELVTIRLLGTKSSKLAEVAPKLISYCQRKKRNTVDVKSILVGLNQASPDDPDDLNKLRQITALRLLPHLMPLGKEKLNRTTVAQLFCPYFKTEAEANEHNIQFKEDYKEDCLVLKPRMHLYGDISSPKVQIYVADQKYSLDNCLIGFDALFKCFLGLNCNYPDETLHVWQFIQCEVYSMDTLKLCTDGSISNIIQSPLWRKLLDFEKGNDELTLFLPINIYFDDFEPLNVIGSHSGAYKVGATYLGLPFLPDYIVSKLEYIFPVA
ncbi:hypothetical protein Bhyg_12152 [Pseudolycoriella hygida]|uniref:Uncharacterized protein n=1 Tax=Pseudolycoriella hygida TaxID=35572 RepID=A0A9Q0S100_9DIPT|nr:hypothetical protein Bhyg_12152 [Pseudolycoriella hygida]